MSSHRRPDPDSGNQQSSSPHLADSGQEKRSSSTPSLPKSSRPFPSPLHSLKGSRPASEDPEHDSQVTRQKKSSASVHSVQSRSEKFIQGTKGIFRRLTPGSSRHSGPKDMSSQYSASNKSQHSHKRKCQPSYSDFIAGLDNIAEKFFGCRINPMKTLARLTHGAKLKHIKMIFDGGVFDNYHAVGMPDIMLNASACYKTSITTVASNLLLDARYQNDAPSLLTYQLISMATRPEVVKVLRRRLLYMGQKKRLGQFLRFNQLEQIGYDTNTSRANPDIQFTEPSRGDYNTLSSSSNSASVSGGFSAALFIEGGAISDPAAVMDPLMITGPRHIGKSHIMFNLAARMAADPGVVVMYISNASDLLVGAGSDSRRKFTQFVEYIACAFCQYDEVNELINDWYTNTEAGFSVDKMRDATRALLDDLRDLCGSYVGAGHKARPTEGITPVIFIDRYDLIANAEPYNSIVTVNELALTYRFVVVLSTSDPAGYQIQPPKYISQCVLSTPLTPKEARRLVVAIAGQLRLSKQEISRIFEAADYHPIDIAGILQTCQMHSSNLTAKVLKRILSEHRYHRHGRLVSMHSGFMDKVVHAELSKVEVQEIKRVGAAQNVIDTDMPQILRKRRDIMRTPFMLYHRIDFRPGTIFDPQFVVKERSPTQSKSSINSVRCMPNAAIRAMYNYHFKGTVQEQFSWLLDEAKYNFEIDQPVRTRYFDLTMLETTHLTLTLTHPLNEYKWTESLHFRALTTHTYFEFDEDLGDPSDCLFFSDAVDYVANYIALDKQTRPSPNEVIVSGLSVMIYFPNLTFQNKPGSSDAWVDPTLSAKTSFVGTFTVCVTRDNVVANGVYQRCEYSLAWIACDPLKIISSTLIVRSSVNDNVPRKTTTAGSTAGAQNVEMPEGQGIESDNYQSPKDTNDYDKKYGYSESWSGKAFRLFPALKNRCESVIPGDSLKTVKVLALAENDRATGIIKDQAQLVKKTPELAQFNRDASRDIGIMATSYLPFYRRISDYFN